VVTNDTSYSNDTKWVKGSEYRSRLPKVRSTNASSEAGNGTRGHAVSEVCFAVHRSTSTNDHNSPSFDYEESVDCHTSAKLGETLMHGVLSNGETYAFSLPSPADGATAAIIDSATALVGHEVSEGWWGRVVLEDSSLVLTKGKGFSCTNRVVSLDEALALKRSFTQQKQELMNELQK